MSRCPPLHWLVVDTTELQMLCAGLQRTKPYAEISIELANIEKQLEDRLTAVLERKLDPDGHLPNCSRSDRCPGEGMCQ